MTPSGTHRDGGPFGINLESLAAQGVCLEMGALRAVVKSNSIKIRNRTNVVEITNILRFNIVLLSFFFVCLVSLFCFSKDS